MLGLVTLTHDTTPHVLSYVLMQAWVVERHLQPMRHLLSALEPHVVHLGEETWPQHGVVLSEHPALEQWESLQPLILSVPLPWRAVEQLLGMWVSDDERPTPP